MNVPNKSCLIICVLLIITGVSRADPIHEAAEAGDIDLVKNLLDDGSNVDAPDLDGTPLQWALLENQMEVARLLLEHGADPNVKGWDGTLLESSALKGNIELVKLLIQHGANLNDGDPSTPLIRAVQKGNVELVELLIKNGANTSLSIVDGTTPLHEAAHSGKLEIAKILVVNGADVNALNAIGRPPIHFAAEKNYDAVVEYLKQQGAEPGEISPITNLLGSADLAQGKTAAEKMRCVDCHITDRYGPPLRDVVGRTKGSVNDYKYSSAFAKLEGKWTYEALNEFLARTTEVVPGTRMNFRGISDPQTRANVILYLRSLSDKPVLLP